MHGGLPKHQILRNRLRHRTRNDEFVGMDRSIAKAEFKALETLDVKFMLNAHPCTGIATKYELYRWERARNNVIIEASSVSRGERLQFGKLRMLR